MTGRVINMGGGAKQSGKAGSLKADMQNRPQSMTLQDLMMSGYSFLEAMGLLSGAGGGGGSGYGGGGGRGGGGGGGGFIDTAARDAALANIASTYATAAAGFQGSEDEYRKIHATERSVGTDSTASAQAGADQAAAAANASRAAERKALGIEDAAAVGIDTVANEQKIATDNIARDDTRMAARTQGHLDNALKYNTDLRAVVELEGKEKQKEIADYYAGQLARISAGRGGGGGYSRSGGGSRSSGGSRGMTSGQIANFLLGFGKASYNEQLGQNEALYGLQDRQRVYGQTGNNLPLAKYLTSGGLYGRKL